MPGLLRRATVILESEGMYLALFDRQSPANDPEHYRALQIMQEAAGREEGAFNDYWSGLAAEGHLLVWPLLFDGVFRVDLCASPPETLPDALSPEWLNHGAEGSPRLVAPSGELVVCSLHRLGDPALETCLSVSPGEYSVRLYGDDTAQSRHEFLTGVETYPAGDGPDWLLSLSPEAR